MKKLLWVLLPLLALGSGIGGVYLYWRHQQESAPPPAPKPHPKPPVKSLPPKPVGAVPQPTNPASATTTPDASGSSQITIPPSAERHDLPPLEKSDPLLLGVLKQLIGNRTLLKLFEPENLVTHLVATLDNLPRRIIPASGLPVRSPDGDFRVDGQPGDQFVVRPDNVDRYDHYERVIEAVDPGLAANLYLQLYPLFQKAYEQLGHPGQDFNIRLLAVIDELLAAPEIQGPIPLVRPKIYYQFADPDLEQRSAGQKMMIRIGVQNERIVKAKLRAFRQELWSRTHEPPKPPAKSRTQA